MASSSTRAESSTSSSSLPPQFLYDVFLSFRGEDVRKSFIGHLCAALVRHGFTTFKDDNEFERGEEIGPELLKSIERSRISVIVFSRNYADSRWCLDELVKILDCKTNLKQIVLPIFYDIDPSDVRALKGSFAEAFAKHEERYKGRGMEGKLVKWRATLTEASNFSGWDLQNVADGHESKFIEKIVKDISNKLNLPFLNVADYPIGIESRVQDINKLLRLESNDVLMVGIWGIGGLGKTTIAKAIYNQIRPQFEGSSFLANIREISQQPNGLVDLQEQLLSNILMDESQNIRNVDQGIEVIKQRVCCRRVLVVLDDVDNFYQCKALAIRRDWFHPGGRIIVTTRDESLLKMLEVDGKYMSELLNDFESLQLFSWHAFRADHPIRDYVELSREVVGYAGGLPLALEVLGSFFKGMSVLEWRRALESLKVIPHDDIQSKLRISFDSLNDEEKALFLDIACFFVGMHQSYVEVGRGFFPKNQLGVLSRRCLIQIEYSGLLTMHGMLLDMGRDIVRREHHEFGKRSRLWFYEEVLDVLTNCTGTEAVESLVINLHSSNDVQVDAEAFAKMKRLRLLELNYVHLSGSYEHLSKRLSCLCWLGFPLKSIPSNLFLEQVVVIDMRYSGLKHVWKGRKILYKLKILNLSHCYHLVETPNFSGCTSLEMLLLNDCVRLVQVHRSIECLQKLLVLDLNNCKNLRKPPLEVWKLTSIQNLSLYGCSKIEELSGSKGFLSESLFSRFSSWKLLVRNPDSIDHPLLSIKGLISIRNLNLTNCNLSYVPEELGSLISLEMLFLGGNNFCTLPMSISNLTRLSDLNLSKCPRLQSLPELPEYIGFVHAGDCTSLERISIGSILRGSAYFNFNGCHKLSESNTSSNFVKRLLEIKVIGELNVSLPWDGVLDCFNWQSVGPDLSYRASLVLDRKIRGWVLCVVGTRYEYQLGYQHKVKNKTKGTKRRYYPAIFPCYVDQTWLHYVPQCYPEIHMEAGDEVEFILPPLARDPTVVKKWGVYVIYEDPERDYPSNDTSHDPVMPPTPT